jgi:hypothetical protein
MEKRFTILIEDDWEIMGNGLGNVAQLQYLPSLYFMKLARRLGIHMTFMVEVAQQLVYNKFSKSDYNLKVQQNLWNDNILLMKHYGFDVQLHLHPQWLQSKMEADYFYLGNNWNLGKYNNSLQENLINESIKYLENLIIPEFPDYKVIAFKGGSWGLQPSGSLLRNMEKQGVRIVMGVRKGMRLTGNGVDYTALEEEILPYYPDYDDLCKIASGKQNIVIIPLQTVKPGLNGLGQLALDLFKRKISKSDSLRHYYSSKIPDQISSLSPISENSKPKFPYYSYRTHLKIGNQPFPYLKSSFDQVISRLSNTEYTKLPILIECHTKQFNTYFNDIEKFLLYIQNKYGDIVEFKTLTEYLKDIDDTRQLVKLGNEK